MVCHEDGLSSGSFFIRVVPHQVGLSLRSPHQVVSHKDGVTSGLSFIRVVPDQGGLSSGWPLIRVVSHQDGFP